MRTLWIATCFCLCGVTSVHAFDRTFTQSGDLTGDGKPESITVHIAGKSIQDPFVWVVTIKDSRGKVLFQRARDDSWLNSFFSDEGYVRDCVGYVACKEQYYFKELPNRIFSAFVPADEPWTRSDLMPILRKTAREYMEKKGIPPSHQTLAIEELVKIVSVPGYHTLSLPYSAVQSDPPMVWVPSVKLFVPYYAQ